MVEALERQASASEALITLATDERSLGENILGPPFCPHCGTFNPEVRNEGGNGPLAEFVLVAGCHSCGKMMYGVVQGWTMFRSADEVVKAREDGNDNST